MDFPISQPAVGLKNGQFVDEDLVNGVPGSVIPAAWANALTNEILNVIKAAEIEPEEAVHNQLALAVELQIRSGLSNYGRFYTLAEAQALTENVGSIMVIGMPHPWYWVQNQHFTGYRSPMSGLFCWGATNQPLAHEIDAIGQVITESDCGGLIARFRESGLVVPSEAWKAGEFRIASLGGGQWKAPDMRDMFIRATGTDVDTANGRTLGSNQKDALQNMRGAFEAHRLGISGVFQPLGEAISGLSDSMATNRQSIIFDASKVARTSTETRSINTALSPRIYR